MEKILDLDNGFEIKLFDDVVGTAFNPSSPLKNQAEAIIMNFKDLPSSWTKVDFILKNSSKMQSKFVGLQILEENVKSKWSLFGEEIKNGLRQYVFSTVIERSNLPTDIVLQKLNFILIEIVKRDWPLKWPTFINDLISVSQSTSMKVATNSLEILKNINEQIFMSEDDITTARKRLLRNALKQEYLPIFQFISLILEYSETQELEDTLLENCLNAFRSFCKSMPPDYVFTTRVVDLILGHLNSPHSVATIDCLLEIVELNKILIEDKIYEKTPEVVDLEIKKITLIHNELIMFFKLYLNKFSNSDENDKLSSAYKKMPEAEQLFLRKYARIFASLYLNWFEDLHQEHVQQGLRFLILLSKIDDPFIFKDILPTWAKLISDFYSEYPLRVPTTRTLKRNSYTNILQQMLPVFVNNMPRPVEVFIIVNDLGEIVKDKKVETAEIEFYKEMKSNLFNLSYCIEDYMKGFFEQKIERLTVQQNYSNDAINKLCWSIGSIAGALEEGVERTFFVSIIRTLLTICEIRFKREEKAVIASNILYIIGQFHRFLKYNSEFLFVVIKKLFEFMEETYEGIKEMVCDNFFKICEKCPNQFFMKKDGTYIFDIVISDLNTVTVNLDFYLQRIVIEGLLIILKNGPRKDLKYISQIYNKLTNQKILQEPYINGIHTVIADTNQFKMAIHIIDSYSLGFKTLPEYFFNPELVNSFLYFFKKISDPAAAFNPIVKKNLQTLKNSLACLFQSIVESGYQQQDFLNLICENVLLDFKTSFEPQLLNLASSIILKTQESSASHIQRLQFFISNLVIPSIPFVAKADEHPQLSIEYLKLLTAMADKSFDMSFPLLMNCPAFDSMINSVLFSLTSMREISSLGLSTLHIFYVNCFRERIFLFFNRFYFITAENILGLIFDKDMKHNYEQQVELFYELISYLPHIPSLNGSGSNFTLVRDFIINMFAQNFNNVTQNTLKLFVEGVFEIKDLSLFKEHLSDFSIKIYEYGNDEDIQVELDILRERIAKCAN